MRHDGRCHADGVGQYYTRKTMDVSTARTLLMGQLQRCNKSQAVAGDNPAGTALRKALATQQIW
jgi:hypothetical protein